MKSVLIIEVLKTPEKLATLSSAEWDVLTRQARSSFLVARLQFLVESELPQFRVPQSPKRHFDSAKTIATKQFNSVKWEAARITDSANKKTVKIVFLKGAAYVVCGLPASYGRIFSDIDCLVEEDSLEKVERALILNGWIRKALSPYDQKYYRKWMHEVPPLINRKRNTVVDLHHSILPRTAKLKPNSRQLLDNVRPVHGLVGAFVLAPADMLLHSATHLFCDGELEHGLRDLVDLDSLFRHFGDTEPGFWEGIVPRAKELDLILPLYYAIRYTSRILGTPIPEKITKDVKIGKPRFPRFMDFLFDRALMPDHPSCDDAYTGFARWALYVRSHYLRMPFRLLIPHLVRKAWKRRFPDDEKREA